MSEPPQPNAPDPTPLWRSPVTWGAAGLGGLALVGAIAVALIPGPERQEDRVEASSPSAPGAGGAPPPAEPIPSAVHPGETDPEPEPTAPKPTAAAKPKAKPRPPSKPKAPPQAQAPAPAPAAPAATSTLMLRAVGGSSAKGAIAANVYVDGKLLGQAPVDAKVAAGKRRVRFDCIFEGKTHRGKDKVIDIPEHTDAMIEHKCDVWVTLGR